MSISTQLPKTVNGYVRLGKSGLKVSKIILGCMSYGSKKWADWVLEEDEAMPHFEAAWKAGINTWDTADMYSAGESERLVGKAIKQLNIPRAEIVILTKLFFPLAKDGTKVPNGNPDDIGYVNCHGSSRKHIFDAVKASLERMGLDYIDIVQLHRFDYETPIEETMDALHDIVKLGYARYIGMSSCYAHQFTRMQSYALSKNQTAFISMQDFHNAIYREEEREMFPTLEHFGVGAIPWSPLARGYLTRPFSDQSTTRAATDPNYGRFVGLGNPHEEAMLQAINSSISSIASKRGYSMAQVALAWSLAQKGVSAPIVGSTKLESLIELIQATHIVLTEEEIKEISDHYRPREIIGHA